MLKHVAFISFIFFSLHELTCASTQYDTALFETEQQYALCWFFNFLVANYNYSDYKKHGPELEKVDKILEAIRPAIIKVSHPKHQHEIFTTQNKVLDLYRFMLQKKIIIPHYLSARQQINIFKAHRALLQAQEIILKSNSNNRPQPLSSTHLCKAHRSLLNAQQIAQQLSNRGTKSPLSSSLVSITPLSTSLTISTPKSKS